jgi:hypothetical protein
VPSGTAGTLSDGFRYMTIVPVLLPAGSYVIGAFYRASGPDGVAVAQVGSITTAFWSHL